MNPASTESLLYLAYGSNLHPLRLSERVPSARLRCVVELRGVRLAFHKRGADGSGKANLVTAHDGAGSAYGALYELETTEKPLLDRFEGEGYCDVHMEILMGDVPCRCFAYIARRPYIDEQLRPYDWYKTVVWLGARHLCLPQAYLETIGQVASVADPDHERGHRHQDLIGRMSSFVPSPKTEPIPVELAVIE